MMGQHILLVTLASLAVCVEAQSVLPKDYAFERTVQIIHNTQAGFQSFAATALNEQYQAQAHAFTQLGETLQPYAGALRNAPQQQKAAAAAYRLILVNPEAVLHMALTEETLSAGPATLALKPEDFARIKKILDAKLAANPLLPHSELAASIAQHQLHYREIEALPLAKPAPAFATATTDGPPTVEVQTLIITDGSNAPAQTNPSTTNPSMHTLPKKVDTLVVRDEKPSADAPTVRIKVANDGRVVDQRTAKPAAPKTTNGVSLQTKQWLFTLLGIAALVILITGLNRYANRKR